MKCYVHSKSEAIASCTNCGRFICKECNVDIDQKSVCKKCIQEKSIFNKEFNTPKIQTVGYGKIYSKIILFLLTFLLPIGFNYLYLGLKNRAVFFLKFTVILTLINFLAPNFYIPWVLFSVMSFIDTLNISKKISKGIHVSDNAKDILHFIKFYKIHCFIYIMSVIVLFYLDEVIPPILLFTTSLQIIMTIGYITCFFTGIYLLIKFINKPYNYNTIVTPIKENKKVAKEKVIENKADMFIEDGIIMSEELNRKSYELKNTNVGEQIQKISEITDKIFEFVKKHPYKARNLKKFVEYYLPTTLKLLENYEHLTDQGLYSKNITESTLKIEKMLHSLEKAYKNQLDSLFEDKALDIDAEINVLSDILKREGLMKY